MQIVWIVLYCLIAAVILFGLTFHDEMVSEQRRKLKNSKLIVINGGKARARRRA